MKAAKQFNVGIILPDQEPISPYPTTSEDANIFNEHIRSRMMSINTTYAPMIREHYEVAPNIPITLHFSPNRNGIPFTDGDVSFDDMIHAYTAITKNGEIQFSQPIPYCDSRTRWFWLDEKNNAKRVPGVVVMAYMLDFKEEYMKDPRSAKLPSKSDPEYEVKKHDKLVYRTEFTKKHSARFCDSVREYYGIHPDTKIIFSFTSILPGSDFDAHSSILGDIFIIINGDDIAYGPVLGLANSNIECEEWWKAPKAAE